MRYIRYYEQQLQAQAQPYFEPIKSFHLKDELNPKIWDGDEMYVEVREQLLTVAQDFYNTTDLEAEIKDIILTGSLANYNWSEKYSDYDVHLLIDFRDVNEDVALVKKLADAVRNIWNKKYDIKIKGYEVEVYIQDINEMHTSTGVFSLLNNKWNVVPKKVDFELDEELIKEKSRGVIMMIDDLENEVDDYTYDEYKERIKKIWGKIKDYRKSGLESEGGEFSTGNLVFKLLRRNGYIGKIISLRRESYEKQFK